MAAFLMPLTTAHAATPRTFSELIGMAVDLLNLATLAVYAAVLLFFFWRIVSALWGYDGNNAEKSQQLRETLFWGVAIIFAMVSIWGIIAILQATLLGSG